MTLWNPIRDNPIRLICCSILVSLGALLGAACSPITSEGQLSVQPAPTATRTGDSPGAGPLVPTPLPEPQPSSGAAAMPATPGIDAPAAPVPALPEPYSLRWRAGVGVPHAGAADRYAWLDPRPGWYLNWHFATRPPKINNASNNDAPDAQGSIEYLIPDDEIVGMEFAPMLSVASIATDTLESVVAQLPGRTWLIGNEPDVRWQDNLTPEAYASGYHRAYSTIKRVDPTARVAIAGVSQVTPLRLAYLDRVLDAYAAEFGQPMPVDVWNMHAFVLQEKRGDWGVDIPPGFDDVDQGEMWTIADHNDVRLVEEQIVRMRRWMHARGEKHKPLWITEYGILMPAEYGFSPETVAAFMVQTFDLFQTLRDPELGLAEDDDRLVQRWLWFSTDYEGYPTGNLFSPTGEPTLLMQTFSAYLAEYEP